MTTGPWQCHICGTVYAWWVSRCRNEHPVTGGSTPESDSAPSGNSPSETS